MFLKISINGKDSLLKIKNLDLDELKNAIELKYNIAGNIEFYTSNNILIPQEDVIEYIEQYISDSNFILYISAIELQNIPETSAPLVISSQEIVPNLNVTTADLHKTQEPLPGASSNVSSIFHLSDIDTSFVNIFEYNLYSQEELKRFIENSNQVIYQNYITKKRLENIERITISKSIVQYLLKDPNRILLPADLENLASVICKVFKAEEPETFYQKFCQGRHANGKLHDAYNNYRHTLAKSGIITRRAKSRSPSITANLVNLDLDSNLEETLQILKTEINISLIIEKWKSSFPIRNELLFSKISTAEYISKFPALEQDEGYKLLYIDVFERYSKDLEPVFAKNFYVLLKNKTAKTKSESIPQIIDLIEKETLDSNKDILALMLLPFILSSRARRFKNVTNKPTKAEIADSFILHFLSCAEADTRVRKILKNYNETNTQVQPLIVLIGAPIELCWVLIAHIKYKVAQPKEALTICLAAYLALNIQYPVISKNVWLFVQKYIFQVSTPYDIINSTLKTLANDLNCLE